MADTFPGQHPEEEIDFVFRQHPIVMRKNIIISLAILVAGILPFSFWPMASWTWWAAAFGLAAATFVFGYHFLGWYFSVYIITNERLLQIRQKGLFNRSVQDISYTRVQGVQYDIKGVQATLFKFGTISVQTYAGPVITMVCIHRPEEVQEHLNRRIRNFRPTEPEIQQGDEEDEGETDE